MPTFDKKYGKNGKSKFNYFSVSVKPWSRNNMGEGQGFEIKFLEIKL